LKKLNLSVFWALLCIVSIMKSNAQSVNEQIDLKYIDTKDLREYIKYLSSNKLAGRMTGEEGQKLAASYIGNACRLSLTNRYLQ
jgi:hypothetical protein